MTQRYDLTYRSWQSIKSAEAWNDTIMTVTDEFGRPLYSATVPGFKRMENMDDIFAKYLNPFNPFELINFEEIGNRYTNYDWGSKTVFYVQDSERDVEDKYTITYDWTYDPDEMFNPIVSNSPVPLMDYRQYFIFTVLPTDTFRTIEWYWDYGPLFYAYDFNDTEAKFGVNYNIILDFSTAVFTDAPAQFSPAFNEAFNVWKTTTGYPNRKHKLMNGLNIIEVDLTCNTHCLYYRNERGGWCWLLTTASYDYKENYTVSSYKKQPNFTNSPMRNEWKQYENYSKSIKTTWTLKTTYMSDEQSAKMKSLFRSNLIYLQDLETRKVTPVNITDTQFQLKTFRNQKGKFAQYTINVQEAYDKKMV